METVIYYSHQIMEMTIINSDVDDEIVQEFRGVIYTMSGLKKGDFKKSLEDALLDYVLRHSKSSSTKDFVRRKKREISSNHKLMKKLAAPKPRKIMRHPSVNLV